MVTRPNPARASIASLIEWFSRGQWTPSEYLRYCLRRIEDENPKIRTVLEVYEEDAKSAAAASSRRFRARKPISFLDGIPIGITANIPLGGHPCHGGIKTYENIIAPEDAKVVRNLRSAGAVILCSLNIDEGGLGGTTDNQWFGRTQHPLKPGFTTGGSSGGAAAAVASGMVPAALGTDTMGGIRIPAAYCGLVGHKPSRHMIPKDGLLPLSRTLDGIGPVVHRLEDAAIMLPIMAGTRRPFSLKNQEASRFACIHIPDSMEIAPEMRSAFATLADWLAEEPLMTRATDIMKDYDFALHRRAAMLLSQVEGARYHTNMYEVHPEGFGDYFATMLSNGVQHPLDKVRDAYAIIQESEALAEHIFRDTDIIVAPTAPQEAFKFGEPIPVGQTDFTTFASLAGLPATTVPFAKGRHRLPLGVQIIGPRGRDDYVLQMAARIRDLIV